MEISPYLLAKMLAYSFLLGICLGVLYDAFRVFRIFSATGTFEHGKNNYDGVRLRLPPPIRGVFGESVKPLLSPCSQSRGRARGVLCGILLFFEDILFFTVCGCAISVLIYYTNDGSFRLMAVVGVFAGFLLYYLTVGRLVMSVAHFICFVLRAVLTYVILALITPSAYLLRGVRRVLKRVRGVYIRQRNKKYDRAIKGLLLLEAEHGFLRLDADGIAYKNGKVEDKNKRIRSKEGSKCETGKEIHQRA